MGYPRALPDYTVGTVTVTAGSRTVTGAGTLWQDATGEYRIFGGDMLCVGNQRPIVIESLQSATQLTLVEPWPHATAPATAYRAILYVGLPSSQVVWAINQVLALLGNKWVTPAKLSDKGPTWDGAGNLTTGGGSVQANSYYLFDGADQWSIRQSQNQMAMNFGPNNYWVYTSDGANSSFQLFMGTTYGRRFAVTTTGVISDGTMSASFYGFPGTSQMGLKGSANQTLIDFGPNNFAVHERNDANPAGAYYAVFLGGTARIIVRPTGIEGNGSGITGISDPRAKEDIQPITATDAEATVMSVRPISFLWRNPSDIGPKFYKGRRRGFLTTDLQPRMPEMVVGEAGAVDDYGKPIMQELHLDQSPLIAELWAHVQALTERIRALEGATSSLARAKP